MSRIATRMKGMLAAGLLTLSPALARQPGPAGPSRPLSGEADDPGQVPQYAVQWREFAFTDMSVPREDYLGITDIDWALSGSRFYLAHGETYALTEWSGRLAGPLPSTLQGEPLPRSDASPYYAALKYRQGSFFMKHGSSIYRFQPRQRRWAPHFTAAKAFTQFEILPGDRVALICPMPLADQPREVRPLVTGVVNKDNEKVPLLEIYARARPAQPEKILPFPPAVASTLGRVNNYPLVDRSLQINDTFLLINGQAGQVFSFDARSLAVCHVATPWPSLDNRFLAAIERVGVKPAKKEGMIKISQFAFPVKIHPYLQNAGEILFAVILNPLCEPGYSHDRDLQESRMGNRFAPLPKEFTREENAGWAWMKYYHYDVRSRTFTELKQPKLSALRLDFAEHWLSQTGDAIPLASHNLGSRDGQP